MPGDVFNPFASRDRNKFYKRAPGHVYYAEKVATGSITDYEHQTAVTRRGKPKGPVGIGISEPGSCSNVSAFNTETESP
jgi:hypothetical protein